MPSQRRNMPEQEQSIKQRSHELFVEPLQQGGDSRPTKAFPVYLRETPAQPFSPLTKTVFWILGILVALLFLAALWRVTQRRGAAHRPRPARPPAKAENVPLRNRDRSPRLPTSESVRGSLVPAPLPGPTAPPGVTPHR